MAKPTLAATSAFAGGLTSASVILGLFSNVTLTVICVSCTAGASLSVTDNVGNVYTLIGRQGSGFVDTAVFVAYDPFISASNTFTVTGVNVGIQVMLFTGLPGSIGVPVGCVDRLIGSHLESGGITAIQPGIITPSFDNSILVTCTGFSDDFGTGVSYDTNATALGWIPNASPLNKTTNNKGLASAYKIQYPKGLENPGCSFGSAQSTVAALQVSFNSSDGNIATVVTKRTTTL